MSEGRRTTYSSGSVSCATSGIVIVPVTFSSSFVVPEISLAGSLRGGCYLESRGPISRRIR